VPSPALKAKAKLAVKIAARTVIVVFVINLINKYLHLNFKYYLNYFYGHVPQTGLGSVQLVAPVSKSVGLEGIFDTHQPDKS
jgi:hypothetical protein